MGLDTSEDLQPARAGLTQPRGICTFISGLEDGTCATQMRGSAPSCSKRCPPFCSTRAESDVAKSRHPEAAAAAGRNLPEPFPQAPPSPASQDWSCLCSLTFQLCPSSSVYVCWGTQESEAASTALTHAKICTVTATPWGLSPGRTRQACSPENIS